MQTEYWQDFNLESFHFIKNIFINEKSDQFLYNGGNWCGSAPGLDDLSELCCERTTVFSFKDEHKSEQDMYRY